MKRHINIFILTVCGILALASCRESYTLYSDAEYVMFSDTISVNMVLEGDNYFDIPVISTTACEYDRTFGVEVIDKGSNAIEGVHYRLKSNTVVIPAGEYTANVEVRGIYDNFKPADSLGFTLKLVMPEQLKWESIYTDRTKVVMYKSCPFDIHDFSAWNDGQDSYGGWCMVTSTFLLDYPGAENKSVQRLIRTSRHPNRENAIILHDWLFTGYDVTISFDPSDPAKPVVNMDKGQAISDEMPVFGTSYGDNRIRVRTSPYNVSSFSACERFVSLWILAYVEDLGDTYGTIGEFFNVLEWVSDEEAERLRREEGM